MKPNQLSKREAKFRNRFIAEHHYNKLEQCLFDEAVEIGDLSYSFIYKSVRNGTTYWFMTNIELRRLSRAMAKFAIVSRTIAKMFPFFTEYLTKNEFTTNVPNPNRWNKTV